MAKRKYTTEYMDFEPLMRYDSKYCIVYGERGDGKSYGSKKKLIESVKNGYKFVYLRRLHAHITRKNMIKVFDDLQEYAKKELGSEIYYESQKGFYLNDGNDTVIGYATSIQDCMLVKSIPITNIQYILFDEFIDLSYMENEIPCFLHTINTICRPPNNVEKIFMLGNTISKFCPYFNLFHIDTTKIKQGEIYYIKHMLGVTATIYHTPTKVEDLISKKKTDSYIGFDDNESVNMIMFGEWEYTHTNIKTLDGITWNCMKYKIPIVVTALNTVYELAIYCDTGLPILFVRNINTQGGRVSKDVKYNLAYDNTQTLTNTKGFVSTISRVNELIDEGTRSKWKIAMLCFQADRVIYNSVETGSNFLHIIDGIQKRGE